MPILALIAVTAIWGVTFVQVKDAVDVYPLFAFLAVRYAIATGVLAVASGRRGPTLGRSRLARRAGALRARRRRGARRAARARDRAADRGARADDRLEHGLHPRSLRRPDTA